MVIRIGLSGLTSLTRLAQPSCSRQSPSHLPFRSFFTSTPPRQLNLLRRSFPRPSPTPKSAPRTTYRSFSSAFDRLGSLRVSLRRGILAFSRTSQGAQRPRAWQGSSGSGRGSRTSWLWNPNSVVPFLIAVNVLVTFLWEYAKYSWERFHDASLIIWMQQNMMLSGQNVRAGRIWTMITCAFSHNSVTHLFMNGLGLYFITPIILQTTAMLLSPRRVMPAFWGLYLGGALVSSLAVLWWRGSVPVNGASGAIYAMLGYQVMLAPTMQVQLYFFIPMQLRILIAGVSVWELYNLLYKPASTMASEAHLGGLAFGLVAGLMLRRYTGFTPRW